MKRYRVTLICAVAAVAGCTTLTKPGMTPESKAKDKYECEQQVYQVAGGNPGMLSNGLYRDCMRARGYT